jgi:hypothetical protein
MARDGTHETDIVGWSEDQAERLRRLAGAERANDAGIDWPNVIEEIEAVGRSERSAVMSRLAVALRHVLKIYGWPNHPAADHWFEEATAALADMQAAIDPGMGQRLDLERAYDVMRRKVEALTMDGRAPRPLPAAIPLSFEDLRDEDLTPAELLGRVVAARAAEVAASAP